MSGKSSWQLIADAGKAKKTMRGSPSPQLVPKVHSSKMSQLLIIPTLYLIGRVLGFGWAQLISNLSVQVFTYEPYASPPSTGLSFVCLVAWGSWQALYPAYAT